MGHGRRALTLPQTRSSRLRDKNGVAATNTCGVSLNPVTRQLDRHARMRVMVDKHIDFVTRTLRKAGVPQAELDDEVQRTFIVVADRLERVEPGAEKAYLYQVANNVAWHFRRGLARRREVLSEDPAETIEAFGTPEDLAHRKGMREILDRIVLSMPEPVRCVFMLYEIEGKSVIDIAESLRIPRGTVASRLRRARAHFRRHVSAIELAWDVGAPGANRIDDSGVLQDQNWTRLERALHGAGASAPPSGAIRVRTLAVLGLS
jgi:RNA polymerase sigma-70 factor, ECF subfamily